MHVIVRLSMWLQVARIFIPYAMRAKKVDMKRLKHAIWDILVSQEGCKVRNHLTYLLTYLLTYSMAQSPS